MQDPTRKSVLAAIPDLFMSSKVSATAGQLDVSVQFAGSRQALLDGARSQPGLIIVDLEADAIDPIGVIGELRAIAPPGGTRLIGFANHVREQRLEEARQAGYDDAFAKGAFAAGLPALLGELRDGPENSVR